MFPPAQLRDAHRKLEALAGPGKATQLKALIEKEALAAAATAKLFARRVHLLQSGAQPTVRLFAGEHSSFHSISLRLGVRAPPAAATAPPVVRLSFPFCMICWSLSVWRAYRTSRGSLSFRASLAGVPIWLRQSPADAGAALAPPICSMQLKSKHT